LLLIPALSFAEDGFQDNVSETAFAGVYDCTGTDPYLNTDYTGTVTVKQQNSVYLLDMSYNTGEKYVGTGGQYNPTLMFVAFQDTKNLNRVGLEQYTLSDDKSTIQGFWVYLKEDKLGKEVCKRRSQEAASLKPEAKKQASS
jgi:hypothetical protein